MKIAVSSKGKDINALIDPRFGRCAYFLIIETDDMSFEVFDNQSLSLGGGAGIQSAQFISSKGVKVVLTGDCGPNAVKTLAAAGIKVFLGNTGIIKEALQKLKNKELTSANTANVSEYSGMADGRGFGRGMGIGGRKGVGRGRRMEVKGGFGTDKNRT